MDFFILAYKYYEKKCFCGNISGYWKVYFFTLLNSQNKKKLNHNIVEILVIKIPVQIIL